MDGGGCTHYITDTKLCESVCECVFHLPNKQIPPVQQNLVFSRAVVKYVQCINSMLLHCRGKMASSNRISLSVDLHSQLTVDQAKTCHLNMNKLLYF